ncbi:MAG: DNA polymerase IV [Bacillota bacterium]|jgi:nucleotidyltransferase/DNA polymerase involved in DNA repair
MERKILHLDMDAFFAAVEQLDHREYRGRPVIVGAEPHGRGVVSTCSYEARKFGVHSAQPIGEALRRCPEGIFLPVRGSRYAEISRRIMGVLSEYTPLVEPLSLDEAFLDLTGSERMFGPALTIARRIVDRIAAEIGLDASIGLAPNKFLAKLGSDLEKPRGFVVFTPENALAVLENLPVSKVWGVGAKTNEALQAMGIRTIGRLARVAPEVLIAKFGEAGYQLSRLAHGVDDRPVVAGEEAKSIGHEITFQTDTADREFLAGVLLWLAEQVARRLRNHRLKGKTVTVKLRDEQFKTITRRTTLSVVTDFEEQIYREAIHLARQANWGGPKVRLIGVSVSGFGAEQPVQLGLFDAAVQAPELARLHETVDALKNRFGEQAIVKGTVLQVQKALRDE